MKTRGKWVFILLSFLVATTGLIGCGGGGGGGGGVTPPAVPTGTVKGTVTAPLGTPTPLSFGRSTSGFGTASPMAVGVAIDNALVRAFDYATGMEYKFDPKELTDSSGNYEVKLPIGKDYILFFERILTTGPNAGKTMRLSAIAPNTYDNQVVDATFLSSLAAEAISKTMGQSRDISDQTVEGVLGIVNPLDNGALPPAWFTVGDIDNTAVVGSTIGTGLVSHGNSTVEQIQNDVVTMIGSTTPPPKSPVLSITPGDNTVTLSWPAVDNATSYNLYWSTSAGVNRGNGTKIPGVSSPYPHTGRTNGTTYFYVLTAQNAGGESPESAQVSATPRAVPGAPTVTATPGSRQVTLSWASVTGATSYNIYWSTASPVTTGNGTKIPNATSPYIHTGRTENVPYYYIVTAVNANGAEGPASAEVSATPFFGTPPPTLSDAKAMVADLRDTAQSLTNYRNQGVTASNGILDNAAVNLRVEFDTYVVPYFQSLGTSLGTFIEPSFQALGSFPNGGDFLWSAAGILSFAGARTDQKWSIHTYNGLNILLTRAYSGSLLVTPVDFKVTSDVDSSLDFSGTFSNIAVNTTYQMVTNADISAYFATSSTGTGTSQRLNVTGNLAVTLNGSGDITKIAVSGNFGSPYLSGSATFSAEGQLVRAEYADNASIVGSTLSRIKLESAVLSTRKGTFRGNFQVDGAPAKITQESFIIQDSSNTFNWAVITLNWDDRTATRKLVNINVNGWGDIFGYGERWISDPPSGSGNTWTLTLHGWAPGETSTYSLTVDRTNPAAPTISGTIRVRRGTLYDHTTNITGNFASKESILMYPTYTMFYGSYENVDPSVPFDNVTCSLTATYQNASTSNPFFVNNYEAHSVSNFPQVRLQFTGSVSTPARPVIRGSVDATSSYITSGGPTSGFAYMKVTGTTNYTDDLESINGNGTVYARDVRETTGDTGKGELKFEKATLNLKNAKEVSFDLQWTENFATNSTVLSGSLYYHPSSGPDTPFGTIEYMNALPIIRWTDGSFESIP